MAENVVGHESGVKGGLQKVSVFDFADDRLRENEYESKYQCHVEEPPELGPVE